MGYADKTGYVEEKNNRYLHQNATDWLKSLRPQSTWKPSEEQMKAVGTAIKFMDYEICTPTVADNLRKLLEQLKTL